jgi:hypothetical protein
MRTDLGVGRPGISPVSGTRCSVVCWLLAVSVGQMRPLRTLMTSLAPCPFPRVRVQSSVFICSSSQRGNVHGAEDSHLHLAFDTLLPSVVHHRFVDWTKPSTTALLLGTLTDLPRSKSQRMAENALLRQQLSILRRQVKRPACTSTAHMLLVRLASMARTGKQALFIIQPETLLRWHRQGFKLYWKYQSRAASAQPKISAEPVAFIKEMAVQNRLWGAERIRGEFLKPGMHVSKRTIQKYRRHARTPRRAGQNGATFLRNHAKDMWACEALAGYRPLRSLAVGLLHDRYARS